ncbi:hypothetical protein BJ978_000982 [Agromyces terreus]|uniref:Phosphatidylinositol diacylglycerol-lyase n=1 Tax=Agromyces terreus TaxID=424795 RepID=A0A9X2GZF4_9MICO|nr:Ca2+-dependent phosphoinositide-specific phospholipase C [Agromyces terreus]MCP2370306.1 hypothetical protein [Agromyces terreus]
MKRTLKILAWIVAVVIVAFALLVGSFWFEGRQSRTAQAARMDELRTTEPSPLVEVPIDDDLPYADLQVIGTHNSYNLAPTWLQTQVISLVEPSEAPALQYDHEPLTDQLDAGIRSLELDVRWNGEDFSMSHVPLVGNRATSPDFGLALEEIALWSKRHEGHLPISIMIEVKSDYMFLDPTLKAYDAEAADALDDVIADRLGAALFTPDDLGDGAWPTVGEMRDRVLFYFGDNEAVHELALDGHPNLEGRSIFTSSKTGSPDARFVILDDPRDPAMAADLAAGVIVRTRADADLHTSDADRAAALDSGAQLISTDYPPSEPRAGDGYTVSFDADALARPVPGTE